MQPSAACRGLYERSNHGGLLSRVNLCTYEKAFYVKGTNCAGMAVSWMEHEARQRGVRVHHSVCGHGEERMIAGYPVDGFCLEAKTLFQFHSCHWLGCPECLVWFQDLEEIDDVCKTETRKRQVDIAGPSKWGLRSTRWPSSGCAVLLLTVWTSSSTGVITS